MKFPGEEEDREDCKSVTKFGVWRRGEEDVERHREEGEQDPVGDREDLVLGGKEAVEEGGHFG